MAINDWYECDTLCANDAQHTIPKFIAMARCTVRQKIEAPSASEWATLIENKFAFDTRLAKWILYIQFISSILHAAMWRCRCSIRLSTKSKMFKLEWVMGWTRLDNGESWIHWIVDTADEYVVRTTNTINPVMAFQNGRHSRSNTQWT